MSNDVHKLAADLMKLDDQMAACMKCGMCQAVCPIFAETMEEADVTRGKIALLEQLGREMIADADGVEEKLGRCLLCGSCASKCPSGVQIMDIFINARVIVASYKGLSPIKKAIFRGLLNKPKLFDTLSVVGAQFQGVVVRDADKKMGTSKCSMLNPILGQRHFVGLAKRPFRKDYSGLDEPRGKSGVKVAFYPGCVADKMYTQLGHACMKIFRHHDVAVYLPKGQACCGIPALASGDKATFVDLIKHNIELFDGHDFDYIVSPCGSCTSTIKETWATMLADESPDLRAKVARLAEKAIDISELVVDVLGVKAPEKEVRGGKVVTYHDPCHLGKALGVTKQPRVLLKNCPEYEFREMKEADRCCGSGGSFNLYHYDLATSIGNRKRDNIRATGAEVATTSCPACMMQMADVLSKSGGNVEVRHVIELYAETLS